MKLKYKALITKEGNKWLGTFPNCPGCQTFADSLEELNKAMEDALSKWLESHLKEGDLPPFPQEIKLCKVKINEDLSQRIFDAYNLNSLKNEFENKSSIFDLFVYYDEYYSYDYFYYYEGPFKYNEIKKVFIGVNKFLTDNVKYEKLNLSKNKTVKIRLMGDNNSLLTYNNFNFLLEGINKDQYSKDFTHCYDEFPVELAESFIKQIIKDE